MAGGGGGVPLLSTTTLLLVFSISCYGQQVAPVDGSDFRTVSYEALVHNVETFTETGISHFTEILFDVKRYQLIVGARDALFRLSLDGLQKLERTDWAATASSIGLCTAKGQSEELCRNYVKVLVSHNDQIFACGTNAFSPKCAWRDIQQISKDTRLVDGRAKCPYSPLDNSTAMMTKEGDYFFASASIDFQSSDNAIYRMKGHNVNQEPLRTVQYDSKWLSSADFVAQFETDDFMYFLLREAATEVINCGKAIYSRVARVCKNDKGGSSVLKGQWTTFLKARMNCSVPGDYPFYYNEIQDAVFLRNEGMVYATFTTGQNSIPGAAVCNFNLSSMEKAFAGDFKHQSSATSTWTAVKADHAHFDCKRAATNDDLLASQKYQLMDEAVPSVLPAPVFTENQARFGRIAVDVVNIKHQDSQPVHVIFVALDNGSIKKLSYNPHTSQTCLVEILHPFPAGSNVVVKNMKFNSNTASVYLATEEGIVKVPVQRCSRFLTAQECLNAMDPYCGWNKQKRECATSPNKNPRVAYWQQNVISCPITTAPVDGKWSEWSSWEKCSYDNVDPRAKSTSDHCQCKTRRCDSPKPAQGGTDCVGSDLVVTNCTQHGQWTKWSEWSGCSQTCGIGLKRRQRFCGNPEPLHGGRVCIGPDVDEQYCDDLPRCRDHQASTLNSPVAVPTWSPWSEWTECSGQCGSGWRSRARKCYGSGCLGCAKDWEECENPACENFEDVTDFSPWVNVSQPDSQGWMEKRFSFKHTKPATASKAGRIAEEKRYCYASDRCTTIGGESRTGSGDFTAWSRCSRECGGGTQVRFLQCDLANASCLGGSMVEQACNTAPCPGTWSCWGEWGGCGDGVRARHRECRSTEGGGAATCQGGLAREEEACEVRVGVWSGWSGCRGGQQKRKMMKRGGGTDVETRDCRGSDGSATPLATEEAGINYIVGACIIGFIIGSCLGSALVYYYFKYKKPNSVTSGHNYISAKSQNLYVSLPMLDLKHKTISSKESDYGGTLRSNSGTLRSSKAGSSVYGARGTAPEYETATIKRSHSRRDSSMVSSPGIRADLDSDQLFT